MSDDVQEVYVSDAVAAVCQLHGCLSEAGFKTLPMLQQLARQAETLHAAHMQGDRRVLFQIWSWLPGAARRSAEDLLAAAFEIDDARLTIAREYGFETWAEVRALGDARPDPLFEAAVDTLLAGDLAGLRRLIQDKPDLVHARSSYGHRAALLHYLGSNGVESHRQVVPMNAVEVAELLIGLGADVTAEANIYGGGQTALALMTTSAHPAEAGVADGLALVLATPAR